MRTPRTVMMCRLAQTARGFYTQCVPGRLSARSSARPCALPLGHARRSIANGKCFDRKDNAEFCKQEDYDVDANVNPCSANCRQGASKCIDLSTDAGQAAFKQGRCSTYINSDMSPAPNFKKYYAPQFNRCHPGVVLCLAMWHT